MNTLDYNSFEEIEAKEESFDFKKLFQKILDNWAFLLLSLTVAVIIAFFLNRYTTPIYVVETAVLIKAPKEASTSVTDLLYGDEFFARNATNLDNESILLKSSKLIRKTLKQLDLDVSYYSGGTVKDSELYESSPITLTAIDDDANPPYRGLIQCNILSPNTFQLLVEEPNALAYVGDLLKGGGKKKKQLPSFHGRKFKFGDTVRIKNYGFIMTYDKSKNKKQFNNQIFFNIKKYDQLTKEYKRRLTVAPFTEESSILKVSFEGPTPPKLKDFLNRLVENYIKNELELKNNIASRTIDFINSQIIFMSDSLSTVEDRLVSFKQSNSGLALTNEASDLLSAAQQLERQRAGFMLNNNYLNELKSQVSNNLYDQLIIPSSIGMNEPNLESAIQDLLNIYSEVRLIATDRNLNNPLIRNYQRQINNLSYKILENIRILQNANNTQIQSLNSRIGGIRSSIQSMPSTEREYSDIQRNYEFNETLYMFLMEKKAEAGIAKASNTVDFRVIDEAEVRGTLPVKPSPSLNYTMAFLLGLLIPSIIIFIGAAVNNKIDSKETLQSLTTIPLVGLIATIKNKIPILDKENSRSALAESIRTLRSNLRYLSEKQQEGKIFLISSSVSGEGKSFCSNNLAFIFSSFNKKILLIDADLRKYGDYSMFGLQETLGLSDYLAGLVTKEMLIQKSNNPNLSVIQSGGIPPNPSELLISGKIDTLLDQVRKEYDYIIIDTPPIGILSDGLELMHKADVCVYVVRQGYTLKRQISELNEIYENRKIRNMALVLNDVNFKKSSYGYGYYQEYSKKNWFQRTFSK